MMNKREIQERLREAANGILGRSQEVEEAMASLDPGGNLSFEEQGTASEFDDVLEQLGSKAREELLQVQAAFRSLEVGNYGICSVCGQPIDEERLRAIPYANLCVGCAREKEKA